MAKQSYTDKEKLKVITDICDDVVENKISFNEAVKNSNISLMSFYKWIAANEEIQGIYNYARKVRSDVLFEQIVDISDESADFQKDRLRIDARKWVVSKMQPKKYGDRLDVTSGDEPIKTSLNITVADERAKNIIESLNEND
jgi:hypothetical protein